MANPSALDTFKPSFGLPPAQQDRILALPDLAAGNCVVGDAPPDLRCVHHCGFVNRFWQRIVDTVREPVEFRNSDGCRHNQVLGQAVFSFSEEGEVKVAVWQHDEAGGACLEDADPATITLVGAPHRMAWFDWIRKEFCRELKWRLPDADVTILSNYAKWVFNRFRNLLHRDCDLRAMRRRIAQSFCLDPWIVATARRIQPHFESTRALTVAHYNHVVAGRAAYRALQREAPNLIPFYAVFSGAAGFPLDGEPVSRLRRYLATRGITPATWRMLVKGSQRLALGVRDHYCVEPERAVLDYILLLQKLGWRQPPPSWFMSILMTIYGHAGNRLGSYSVQVDGCRLAAFRRVVHLFRGAPVTKNAIHPDSLYPVLLWISEASRESGWPSDATVRRAPWQWFLRRSQAWLSEEALRRGKSNDPWPVPVVPVDIHGFTAVILSSPLDLWRESQAMRHCVDTYVAQCRQRTAIIVSLRRKKGRRPAATLCYGMHNGNIVVRQAVGFANSAASSAVRAAARLFIDRYGDILLSFFQEKTSEPAEGEAAGVVEQECHRLSIEYGFRITPTDLALMRIYGFA